MGSIGHQAQISGPAGESFVSEQLRLLFNL